MENKVSSILYCNDANTNRNKLFNFALNCAKTGKVLYILNEELNELPELYQDQNIHGEHMKMISFVYAKSLGSLVECISTLPDWKNVPATIILDDLTKYCDGQNIQDACGIISFIIDAANSCSQATNMPVTLCVSITADNLGNDYCTLLKEMYFNKDLKIKE